jgi:hypothetical protein
MIGVKVVFFCELSGFLFAQPAKSSARSHCHQFNGRAWLFFDGIVIRPGSKIGEPRDWRRKLLRRCAFETD